MDKADRIRKLASNKEGRVLPPTFEPGVVGVIFKDSAKIRLSKSETQPSGSCKLMSKAKTDLNALNKLLADIECTRISPTFTSATEEEYDSLYKKLRAKQKEKAASPNLNNFFTIHFPPTLDPKEVAKRISELPMVEKAYPVPTEAPPNQIRIAELDRTFCRTMSIIGPCRFASIVAIPLPTPLNEPLVGDQDTTFTIDPARNLQNQWYIFRCNADSAWALGSGAGVVVADVDWGFRTTHEELSNKFDLAHAYNAYDGSSNVSAGSAVYHGTGVCGHAGAQDNGKGMIGFAFGCTLWPIQGNTGTGSSLGGSAEARWARAIDWVRSQPSSARKVIILEVQFNYGNAEMMPAISAAIVSAIADNIVVCVAAGNGDRDAGLDDDGDPIPFTGSIVVGATRYDSVDNPRWFYSNWGSRVDVAAPGDQSTGHNDGDNDVTCHDAADDAYTNHFGGTSGATPKVAGTVAIMLQCNPDLTPSEVRDIIRSTASSTIVTDAGKPIGGFLDTYAAVNEACRRANPCSKSLIVNPCTSIRVVDGCRLSRIGNACLKSNILVDPCKLKSIVAGPCNLSKIVVGPCGGSLIAGDPFWRFEEFKDWAEAYENIRNETLKHFKKLSAKK